MFENLLKDVVYRDIICNLLDEYNNVVGYIKRISKRMNRTEYGTTAFMEWYVCYINDEFYLQSGNPYYVLKNLPPNYMVERLEKCDL